MMLSYKYKIPGVALLIIATILTLYYFLFNFRFEFPVFAVVSSYSETRFFWWFSTNFADELILLLFTFGFTLTIFSGEKTEFREFKLLRRKAIYRTIIAEIGLLIFIILFSFGSAFIALIILNLFLPFVLYIVFFNVMKLKVLRKKQKLKNITN